MAGSLHHHSLPSTSFDFSSFSSPFLRRPLCHGTSLYKFRNRYPLSAISAPNQNPSSSTPPSTPSIFLPYLQQQQGTNSDTETPPIEPPKDKPITDPIHKFFKLRTSSQHPDPPIEGKFTLQKNRRTSWHLSPNITNFELEEPEPEPEEHGTPGIDIAEPEIENEENGGFVSGVISVSNNIVNEVLEIAKNLPENVTLGEVLGPYEGKLSEKECVQVLGLMGQEEGLIMCCLYFFEWMSLQEPSLVTPWAYSALFPVLGRARMGDKIMILFNNLPNTNEFKQVHVYNSAISALSCCGR